MRFQTVAYLRVSSIDQNVDRQVDVVGKVDKTFVDRISGSSREERTALAEMIDYVREGDTIRVAAMDRLARSVIDLSQIVQQCTAKGVSVEFVAEGLTFAQGKENPYAEFALHMLGSVAQLERSLIRERQRQGIALARTKRTYRGRTAVLTAEQVATARYQLTQKIPKAQIARDLGVSRSALYDALAGRGAYVAPTTTRPTMAGGSEEMELPL
ncbi:recombinase family protein [Allobranchiibius sp. GilTou38]|uniref:recombinase family protein n=1 Tax=Allobranchiibius sp. GilTou38 TaxID=2815210 RepID=UPI001AA11AF9|nr:recombinase family protein [Allobranchiibius sp. GilTou38]